MHIMAGAKLIMGVIMGKPKMEFLSSIAPHTGLELLRSIGGAPWSLVSHGEQKFFPFAPGERSGIVG